MNTYDIREWELELISFTKNEMYKTKTGVNKVNYNDDI